MTNRTHTTLALSCALAALVAAGCGGDAPVESASTTAAAETSDTAETTETTEGEVEPVIDPGDGGDYRPALAAADVVDRIDNPFFPLLPGTRWVYEGRSGGEVERIEVEVLEERRTVMGIEAVVVRDQAFVDGELAEDTLDFFTQDTDGNVWYLGEETAEYEGGQVTDTAGSWQAGVDGALPGIVMPAAPAVGDAYRQEFLLGEAEDMGEVLSVEGSVEVPAGTFDQIVTTRDWTPLEPDVVEEKEYAPGVGLVAETKVVGGEGRVELIEFTPGA